MNTAPNPGHPAPGQTIVIERRERSGCFRKLLFPVLVLSVVLNLIQANPTGMMPRGLEERYVAGEVVPKPTLPKIAVVELDGIIIDSTAEHVLKQIRQAREDK